MSRRRWQKTAGYIVMRHDFPCALDMDGILSRHGGVAHLFRTLAAAKRAIRETDASRWGASWTASFGGLRIYRLVEPVEPRS